MNRENARLNQFLSPAVLDIATLQAIREVTFQTISEFELSQFGCRANVWLKEQRNFEQLYLLDRKAPA